jgi:hypothetical protein
VNLRALSVKARWLLVLNVALVLTIGIVAASSCGRGGSAPAPASSPSRAGDAPSAAITLRDEDGAASPMDPRLADLWERARSKDVTADDLARLAKREGSTGLVERAQSDATFRLAALRAMAYVDDFVGLPWLADMGESGSDEEASAALESAVDLAARPRRPVDPEDAEELHAGCAHLLATAKDKSAARVRRILAIRSLRMLVDRGCAPDKEIPTDLDAH